MEAIGESKLRMPVPDTLPWSKLTQRERQVLDGIAAGLSNAEMATELFVSVNTIKFHVANVLHKLEVRSRVDAAVLAAVNGRTQGRGLLHG